MRRFSADYLEDTRRGLWDDRAALDPLALDSRERVLDAGCGTGELTAVLAAESPGEVIAADADGTLLREAEADGRVRADATRLPFGPAFDLVACQALLVNLPDPAGTLREFARVSTDLVAAIEPDNAAVAVDSTVGGESALAASAREAYVRGIGTDVTLGSDLGALFAEAGLVGVETRTRYHRRVIEAPYDEAELEGARRKVRASRLADARPALLAGGMSESEYEALASDWRAMGRAVVEQMNEGSYRRAEVVPFHVAVGRVQSEKRT
jgi:SAM-dependent methyltransferase